MTKFEEEFKALTSWDWVNVDLIQQILTRFGNWHSDEEFQIMEEIGGSFALANKNLIDANTKLAEEIANLKSQLQQQALPVVPELTQKQADTLNDYKNGSGSLVSYLSTEIKKGDYDYFARAWLDGYTVEKPQLFYLREKNTNYYLNKSKNNGLELVPNPYFDEDNQFTKQEIDSMQTGSYELVPVEDGE